MMMRNIDYQCPRCKTNYTFDEYIHTLETVWVDPENKQKYGRRVICGCGYRFHLDKPRHQTFFEFTHHITAFHWLFNKLSLGRYCKPTQIDGMVSAVHLELNHGYFGEPIFWEVLVLANADRKLKDSNDDVFGDRFEKMVNSYDGTRNTTMELIEADHKELVELVKAGKYLIMYELWKKKDGKLHREGWRLTLMDEHKRYFHNVQITDDRKEAWM